MLQLYRLYIIHHYYAKYIYEMTDLEQEEMLKDFKKHMNPKIYRCNACGIEGTNVWNQLKCVIILH